MELCRQLHIATAHWIVDWVEPKVGLDAANNRRVCRSWGRNANYPIVQLVASTSFYNLRLPLPLVVK
jgi:hypothetical protein